MGKWMCPVCESEEDEVFANEATAYYEQQMKKLDIWVKVNLCNSKYFISRIDDDIFNEKLFYQDFKQKLKEVTNG